MPLFLYRNHYIDYFSSWKRRANSPCFINYFFQLKKRKNNSKLVSFTLTRICGHNNNAHSLWNSHAQTAGLLC